MLRTATLVCFLAVMFSFGCAVKGGGPYVVDSGTQQEFEKALALENAASTPLEYQQVADIYSKIGKRHPDAAMRLANMYREDSHKTFPEESLSDRMADYMKWLLTARELGSEEAISTWESFVCYAGNWMLVGEDGLDESGRINNLGVEYYYGRDGKPQDMLKAYELFKQSAEGYDWVATGNLGAFHYYEGPKAYRDDKKAVEYFARAALMDVTFAQYFLAECYELGRGVTRDYNEAARWYVASADRGSRNSMYRLGKLLYDGKIDLSAVLGVGRKVEVGREDRLRAAREFFRRSGEGQDGYALGAYMAGVMAEKGQGGPANLVEARKWYDNAVRLGYEKAARDAKRLAQY